MRKPIAELPDADAALLDLGVALGQNYAFAVVAGRCSAAQAAGLRRLRDDKSYKRCTEHWEEFRSTYLKISRAEVDRRVTAILNDDLQYVSSDLRIRILASLGYRVRVSVVRSDSAGQAALS